jgi:type IX secretion system PorP/SprF family membrane protein
MKKLFSIIYFVCAVISVSAQQIPQYSQYMRNQFMVNPGAAGVYDFMDFTMSGRWQWVGFGDEPRTAFLSGSTVIGKRNRQRYNPAFRISQGVVRNPEIKTGKLKHAVGGQLLADQYGAFRKLNFAGTYAIHLPVSRNYNLSFGTRLGLTNNSFLQDKAVALNPTDPFSAYGGGDQGYDDFVANNSNKFIMDVGAGFYLYSKKMFFGVAADHLSRDFVEFGSGTVNFNTQIHFNATAGIKLPINDDLTLIPSVLVKNMRPAPFSLEGSLLAEYKEWLWMGVSYRNSDAVVGMFGFNVSETFKFGYSYDFSVSRMNQVSSGGHELVLGIMLR